MAKPYYNPGRGRSYGGLEYIGSRPLGNDRRTWGTQVVLHYRGYATRFRQDESRCRIGCIYRGDRAFPEYACRGAIRYKYKLFGGVLSGGLQIGLVNQSFDGTKVIKVESEYHQETDAAIPVEQVSGMGLDMNFGIYYTHKRFYAGFGMTHITQPELQLDENAYTYIGRSLNLMGDTIFN